MQKQNENEADTRPVPAAGRKASQAPFLGLSCHPHGPSLPRGTLALALTHSKSVTRQPTVNRHSHWPTRDTQSTPAAASSSPALSVTAATSSSGSSQYSCRAAQGSAEGWQHQS